MPALSQDYSADHLTSRLPGTALLCNPSFTCAQSPGTSRSPIHLLPWGLAPSFPALAFLTGGRIGPD